MKPIVYHILRVGLAITFLWIGVMIFQDPLAWGSFLRPWAQQLVPIPLAEAMTATAVLDLIVGLLLLVDVLTWLAGIVGSLHIIIVIITVGIDPATVRDIGLLGATIALTVAAWPSRFKWGRQKTATSHT